MKTPSFLFLFVCLSLIIGSVTFANNVVVIPLNKGGTASITEPWIKVYDANDTFVGYFIDGDVTGINPVFYVVSTKGYIADFQTGRNYGGYDWNPSVEELIYLSPPCTGPMYMRAEQYGLLRGGRPGSAFLSSGSLDFYIPLDAPAIAAPQYYSGPSCLATTPPGGAHEYYEMKPNDPAVTGFENSYTVPFKAVFTLPAAP